MPEVELSNTDKVLFPDAGITKGDLIDYYEGIAGQMLPHVQDRPITLHRFPDGIEKKGFYRKQASDYFPDWIDTVTVKKEDGRITHVLAQNASTLKYLANQATIDLHVWLSRKDKQHHPDRLIFDLDPPDGDFEPVREAARSLHGLLDELGLAAFVMTTGSRGLHVAVPLDRKADFDTTCGFAKDLARLASVREPDKLTTEQRKDERKGRLYLDVSRNAYGQTGVAPYSLRARAGAPVATPLEWDELNDPRLTAGRYTMKNIFSRLDQRDDPWAGIGRHAQSLKKPRQKLQDLIEGIDEGS